MPTSALAPMLRHVRKLAGAHAHIDAELLSRFVRGADPDALDTLIRRHGPMVLGLCRRIVGNNHDADDAFQATFLVFVRSAAKLKRPELVANWLFGVARRVALKARARMQRNRRREGPISEDCGIPNPDPERSEILPLLDDAIAGLPAKYRVPTVLCYLQGHSHAETALRLGCAPGTVATRLARAKTRLRARLLKMGVTSSLASSALSLPTEGFSAAVPPILLRAACSYGSKTVGTAIAIPASILTLTEGLGHTMVIPTWKLVIAAFVTVGAASAGGTALLVPMMANEPPIQSQPRTPGPPAASAPKSNDEESDKPHVCGTLNFVVSGPSARVTRLVAEAAEDWRSRHAMQWLGKELPPWTRPCPIKLTLRPQGHFGSTKINYDFKGGTEILSMELQGSLDGILANSLPHEITHAVLATYLRKPIPRWADEGAATLAEDVDEQELHAKLMREHVSKQESIPLRRMLTIREYSEVVNVMVMYVQGHSIVQFLVERKDKPTLLKFLDRGMTEGWDAAAKQQYGFATVEKLEEAWLKDLEDRKIGAGDRTPIKDGEDVLSPPETLRVVADMSFPQAVRATIDEEGRLRTKSIGVSIRQVPVAVPTTDAAKPIPTVVLEPEVGGVAERRYSLVDVRGFRVKDHKLEEIELRRLAELLRHERVVIAALADGPREALNLLLEITKDETIVLFLPRPRTPAPPIPAGRIVPLPNLGPAQKPPAGTRP
jgi:RNA polymerase sigma factor (sigma-70 family)